VSEGIVPKLILAEHQKFVTYIRQAGNKNPFKERPIGNPF
jgi:hypothetical protein